MGRVESRRQKVDNFTDSVGHAVDDRGLVLLRGHDVRPQVREHPLAEVR